MFADLLTTFLYLVYYTFTLGSRPVHGGIAVMMIAFFLWPGALLAGATHVFLNDKFYVSTFYVSIILIRNVVFKLRLFHNAHDFSVKCINRLG